MQAIVKRESFARVHIVQVLVPQDKAKPWEPCRKAMRTFRLRTASLLYAGSLSMRKHVLAIGSALSVATSAFDDPRKCKTWKGENGGGGGRYERESQVEMAWSSETNPEEENRLQQEQS